MSDNSSSAKMPEITRSSSIQLKSKLSLKDDAYWQIMEGINKAFPSLDQSSVDKDEGKYKLSAKDSKDDETSLFIMKGENIVIATKEEVDKQEWKNRVCETIKIITDIHSIRVCHEINVAI